MLFLAGTTEKVSGFLLISRQSAKILYAFFTSECSPDKIIILKYLKSMLSRLLNQNMAHNYSVVNIITELVAY